MEKVSAIVAIYKSEAFLPKLIDSIISQTWENLEILLIDDGSPDNSGTICDEYAKRDNRIRVIHKKNGGACAARNTGLSEATGEYILIIDGDDSCQVDLSEYSGINNGLKRVSKIFKGQDYYGEVTLEKCYRSRIADQAEKM